MKVLDILTIFKYLLYAIPILFFVFVGVYYESRRRRGEKTVWKKQIGKKALVIVFFTVLYCGSYLIMELVEKQVQASTIIGFNYAEASKGLYPNNTRFNTYDILDDEILNEVLATGEFGNISVETLRSALSVEPLDAGEELSSEQYYVSTEYVLRYQAKMNTIHLPARKLVDTIANIYHQQFLEKYSRKSNILELDFTEYDQADFLDQIDMLEVMASNVVEYLNMMNIEAPLYFSETGETFASIASKVKNYQEVELERLASYVLTNGIARDKSQLLSKLGYENRMKIISYMKNMASYQVRLETIDMYERDMASIVLVPTRDEKGEFYMGRTKVGVDNFAKQADEAIQTAKQIQTDILSNQYAMNQIHTLELQESDLETMQRLMNEAKEKLFSFTEEGRQLVLNYDAETAGDFLTISGENLAIEHKRLIKNTVILAVVFSVSMTLLLVTVENGTRREHIV